ncbi:hypothetical protein F511_22934 [Dorcoceras hygrometricum]|uniref:Uncharacterized protein n=1 Tax=Dorcoceras hygrometricum TaxID=472368 RepID=A0A2Z7BK47_9LAMI|nr:hypothetical protein F511_22934 [Dorcoceras hygrometricum]
MPELEELPADEELQEVSVQNMVDRIEGHPHGRTIAKETAEPQDEILEKNVVDVEEASKMMAEGILAYVKAVRAKLAALFQPTQPWKKDTRHLIGEMSLFTSGAL